MLGTILYSSISFTFCIQFIRKFCWLYCHQNMPRIWPFFIISVVLTLVQAAIISHILITNTFQQVSLFLPLSPTPSLVPAHQPELSFHNGRHIVLLLCSKPSYSIQRKSKVSKTTCKAVHDLHLSASLLNVTALQPHWLSCCSMTASGLEYMLLPWDFCVCCSVCLECFSSTYPLG